MTKKIATDAPIGEDDARDNLSRLPCCHLSAVPMRTGTVNYPSTARHTLSPTLTLRTGSRHHLRAARRAGIQLAADAPRPRTSRRNDLPNPRCAVLLPAASPRYKP